MSCSKNEDSTAPVVTDLNVTPSSPGNVAQAGGTINVSAIIRDNEALSSVIIEVEGGAGTANWSESLTVALSGTEAVLNEAIAVPRDVADGSYRVILRATDKQGNTSNAVSEDFNAVNNLKPEINVTRLSAQAGGNLRIEGQVTDDQDLVSVVINITIPPGYSGNQTYYNEQFNLNGSGDTSWDFQQDGNVSVYFPMSAKRGEYSIRITAVDSEGYISAFKGSLSL